MIVTLTFFFQDLVGFNHQVTVILDFAGEYS